MAAKKTHLVIGATGNTGQLVTTGLQALGQRVRVMIRKPEQAARFEGMGVEVAVGDLDIPSSLDGPFDGIDAVYVVTSPNTRAADQAMNAIDAAKRNGVRHVVRHSTARVDTESPFPTARDHARVELYLKASGVPYTIVRTHWYMQNMLLIAQLVQAESSFHWPVKDGRVGMVDLRDLAAVIVDSMANGRNVGETLTITGPEPISMSDAARVISQAIGRDVTYHDMPLDDYRQHLLDAGIDPWVAEEYVRYMDAIARGWGDFVCDDFERAMGRPPKTFAEFVKDHVAAYTGGER